MFLKNIEKLARNNHNFREVVYTGKNSQLVLMSIGIDEDIGEETHETVDQILFFVEGKGQGILNGQSHNFEAGDVAFVPAGTLHNFINTGSVNLKLYTVYAPPNHPPETLHPTKEDAIKDEEDTQQKGGE